MKRGCRVRLVFTFSTRQCIEGVNAVMYMQHRTPPHPARSRARDPKACRIFFYVRLTGDVRMRHLGLVMWLVERTRLPEHQIASSCTAVGQAIGNVCRVNVESMSMQSKINANNQRQ